MIHIELLPWRTPQFPLKSFSNTPCRRWMGGNEHILERQYSKFGKRVRITELDRGECWCYQPRDSNYALRTWLLLVYTVTPYNLWLGYDAGTAVTKCPDIEISHRPLTNASDHCIMTLTVRRTALHCLFNEYIYCAELMECLLSAFPPSFPRAE